MNEVLETKCECGEENLVPGKNRGEKCQELIDNCSHICTSNCRRSGCNCDCGGEFHEGEIC